MKLYINIPERKALVVGDAYTPEEGDILIPGTIDHHTDEEADEDSKGAKISHTLYDHVQELMRKQGYHDVHLYTIEVIPDPEGEETPPE